MNAVKEIVWAQEDFALVYELRSSEELCGVFDLKKRIKAKSCGLEGNSEKRQNIEVFSEEQSECVNFDVCVHLIYFCFIDLHLWNQLYVLLFRYFAYF